MSKGRPKAFGIPVNVPSMFSGRVSLDLFPVLYLDLRVIDSALDKGSYLSRIILVASPVYQKRHRVSLMYGLKLSTKSHLTYEAECCTSRVDSRVDGEVWAASASS